MNSRFRGTGVAIITPFRNGKIDFDALQKMVNHVISGTVEYIVSLGSTGESITLDPGERRDVLDATIEAVAGRVPLVAGNFGDNNTRDLCKYIDSFHFNKIDAILSSSPAYNKPSQEGIYQHYKAVSTASPVPVILYNVPSRTASNITAETTIRIAKDCPNVIGIKEASGDMVQGSKIIKDRPDGFLVISGDDPTALPLIALGGDGVISVIANALPLDFSSMIRAALKGDYANARKAHESMLDIHPHLYAEGNPSGIKSVTASKGLTTAEVRLPLTPISEERARKLAEMVKTIRG